MLKHLKKYKIILGSNSPRRKKLLSELNINFDVISSNTKETYSNSIKKEKVAEHLAHRKALNISKLKLPENYLLITADTTVLINGKILNKPKNINQAQKMLQEISDQSHQVITGICIKTKINEVLFSVSSEVIFNKLSLDEISYYIKNFKPFDKAGSYGIQEWIGHVGVKTINGSYTNIMGFPTNNIYENLKKNFRKLIYYICKNHSYKTFSMKNIIKIFIVLILVQSCTPMKKITYLNNSESGKWDISPIPPKHQLEIGDVLMVKVISRNEELNNLFNIENNTNSANEKLTSANLYLNGFTISQDGTIDIPNVGKVYILNQTIDEAKETILKVANDYLINPFVIVKLANFEFTILGEVNLPGKYPIYKESITIYDAIAMAGDINDFADLKKVKIIRSNKNNKKTYNIDLTQANIMTSDFFYLKNNDLIYIQPLKYKGFRKSQSQTLLSVLTTVAILFNVYLKATE